MTDPLVSRNLIVPRKLAEGFAELYDKVSSIDGARLTPAQQEVLRSLLLSGATLGRATWAIIRAEHPFLKSAIDRFVLSSPIPPMTIGVSMWLWTMRAKRFLRAGK